MLLFCSCNYLNWENQDCGFQDEEVTSKLRNPPKSKGSQKEQDESLVEGKIL